MSDVKVDIFLAHYGVKGMKWGVRNDRRSNSTQPKKSKPAVAGADPILIGYGLALATTILAVKGANYLDSGRKDAKKTGTKEFKKNPALKKRMPAKQLHAQVVKPINPDYPAKGTKMNCRRATLAYEMRRRGYDVKATKSNLASGQAAKGINKAVGAKLGRADWGEKPISTSFTFSTHTPQKKAEMVFSELGKNPNGARGELGLGWTMGGGHSIAWEIVGGKPVIFDTQNGKMYTNAKEFAKFTPVMVAAAQTRLDNKTIDSEFIKRWVTDV